MKETIILILVFFTFLLMFSQKTREFVKKNKEEVLFIAYVFMAIWFSYVLLRPNNFKIAISYMHKNILYGLYIIIYIAIPAYFIYTAYKSYKELQKKRSNKKK